MPTNVQLTPSQTELCHNTLAELNDLEGHKGVKYLLIKHRYFKICRITPEINEMIKAGLPIFPKSLLTFSFNRIYPLQTNDLNNAQIQVLNHFVQQWQQLNQIGKE